MRYAAPLPGSCDREPLLRPAREFPEVVAIADGDGRVIALTGRLMPEIVRC